MNRALLNLATAGLLGLMSSGATMAAESIIYTTTPSVPISTGMVTPVRISPTLGGGNQTCATVGEAIWGNAEYYQCSSARVNYPDGFNIENPFRDITGNSNEFGSCVRNQITATVSPKESGDGTYVAFTAEPDGVGAAIVKGGNDANVYVYNPQRTADSGLASPLNASLEPAGLSNLTLCWNPVDMPPPKCYTDETAWGAGGRYVTRGNWATYTEYSGTAKYVTLFAGQTYNAGTVYFSDPDPSDGTVTITVALNPKFRFALNPVGENPDGSPIYDNNLKAQDYSAKPNENPSPGLFMWKEVEQGQQGEIKVPNNRYYGVHVDVEREISCPTP